MQFKRKYQRRSYIDVTPIIDVIFNLLLFFIVVAFLQNRQGIKINLPVADNSTKEAVSEYSVITVTNNLEVFVNDKKIKIDGIGNALKIAAQNAKEKILFIRADGKVPHEIVVNVMDLAKKAGFVKLSIATKKNKSIQ